MSGKDRSLEWKRLEADIQHLDERIQAHRAAERHASRTSVGLALLIAGVVLSFLGVNYVRARAELTAEKLAPSLEAQLHEVAPVLLAEIAQLGEELLPVYAEESQRQLERAWPEISSAIHREIAQLGENLATSLHGILEDTESRLSTEMTRSVLESYPTLRDPKVREDVEERLRAVCDNAVLESLERFDRMFSDDVERLEQVIVGFELPDTSESTVDLQKRFLHLWLRLLDQEIMGI